MKRILLYTVITALVVMTVIFLKKVDNNTKQIAGFLDSNVFFEFKNDAGQTTLTILNQKIKLR